MEGSEQPAKYPSEPVVRSCSACVAGAISRGHLHCLQALLAQSPLQSEFVWFPSLHLLPRPRAPEFPPTFPCRPECPSRSAISNKEKSTAPSEFQCGHLRVSAANERDLVENTKYSTFLAINVKYLALRSANPEIRTFCIQHFKMDPLCGLLHQTYWRLTEKNEPKVVGPLEVARVSINSWPPTTVLSSRKRTGYHTMLLHRRVIT